MEAFIIDQNCGIYLFKSSANGKIYIGQSIILKTRKGCHFNSLKRQTHRNKYLQRHYNKYGQSDLGFSILEFCPQEKLNEREIFWIKKLKSLAPNGFNLTEGGDCPIRARKRHTIINVETKEILENVTAEDFKTLFKMKDTCGFYIMVRGECKT